MINYFQIYNMDKEKKLDERKRIGSTIRAIREEQGLTQQQLAEKVGTSRSTIGRVELGDWSVSLDLLTSITSALDKRVEII